MNHPQTNAEIHPLGIPAHDPMMWQLWDHSFDAMRVTSENGTVQFVNQAYCRLARKNRSELVGKPFWIVYADELQEEVRKRFERRFKDKVIENIAEREIVRWDGKRMWLELSTSSFHAEDGSKFLMSIFREITERKQAESDLKLQKAWFEQLFANMSLAVVMLDERQCVRSANQRFEQMFGFDASEICGKAIDDLIVPESLREESVRLAETTERMGMADAETVRSRKDGSLVHVRVLGIPIRLEGRLVGVYGVYEDIDTRRKAEDAVRASEERYRSLVERMQDGVYRSTAQGRFLDVNPAMVEMFGYASREEMLTIDIPTMLYFDQMDRESLKHDGDGIHTSVIRMRKKDGTEIWVEDHGMYVRDTDGRILCHEGIVRDITERKRMEDAMRESEERFRTLVVNAQDVIGIFDRRGIIRYMTDTSERILGYAPTDLLGKDAFDLIHPDDVDIAGEVFRRIQDGTYGGEPITYRFRHANGSWITLESIGRNLLGHPGIQGIVVTSSDITERRRSEEALRESEARFRAVVEQSADGIYLIDVLTLEVVHSNAAFCSMMGYTIAEMQKLAIFNIISDGYSEINRRVSGVLTGHSPLIEERIYRLKNGSPIDVLASASVIAYGGKRVICTIVRDISERKKLERERELLIKELQDALSNIRTLGGLIPICSSCKKIRDDKGYWNHLEKYLSEHSDATLSHGICPDCAKKLYPEVFDK